MKPVLVGLTGGIGSGKSTVASLFAECGAAVIDSDVISRASTAAGGRALPAIAAAFGPEMIGADGALNRDAMRAQVYRDPGARKRLEAIIHPIVGEESNRLALDATRRGHPCLVFDVPLLVESGPRWRARVDRVLVVDCDAETQIARVMSRNHLSRQEVERILKAQASRAQRLSAADAVLYNGVGSRLSDLRSATKQIAPSFGL